MGPKLERLLERERQGRDVPELHTRPALGNRTQWIMDAFDRLSTERPLGFGSWGQIPHSKVVAEALRLGLGEEGLHELWTVIHALDDQWRAVANKPPAEQGAIGGGLSDQDHRGPVRRGRRKSGGDP